MKSVEGTFSKYAVGYSRVLIEIETDCAERLIKIDLDKEDEWNQQLFQGKFDDWFEGAIYGANFALDTAKVSNAVIKIKRIVGQTVDTNATTVASATAKAVWKAVDFAPPELLIKNIEEINKKAWVEYDLIKFE